VGGGEGLNCEFLIQKPRSGVSHHPLASETSTGSRSRAGPSVISWPQHSPSFIAVGWEF
jgi:hypothetical protein